MIKKKDNKIEDNIFQKDKLNELLSKKLTNNIKEVEELFLYTKKEIEKKTR